jgi:hypothetical protein
MIALSLCIDRFEGNVVILLDQSGQKRFDYPCAKLPSGLSEGDWLMADLQGDRITSLRADPEAMQAAKSRIEGKLERLHKRSKKQENEGG